LLRRPDDDYIKTETYSYHFLTGLLRRPDDVHIKTETFTEDLLTGLVRRPDASHVSTETCSLSHNNYDVFDIMSLSF
jgi:hypothetical protein